MTGMRRLLIAGAAAVGLVIAGATAPDSASAAGPVVSCAHVHMTFQFQYLDVGVNIDMTPTVHYDHEVTLKMKIEVLSQANTVTISGVQEPIIGQRSSRLPV